MVWGRTGSRGRPGRVDQDLGWWPLAGVLLAGGFVCLVAGLSARSLRPNPVPALVCAVLLTGLALAMAAFRRAAAIREIALWVWLGAALAMLAQTGTLAEQVLVANAVVLGALYAATCVTGWRLAVYLGAAVLAVTIGAAASPAHLHPVPWAAMVAMVLLTGTVTARHLATLRHAASTDPLTGALNRAALRTAAPVVLAAARRHGTPLSVALVDLDRFKAINDSLGHAAGDELLIDVVVSWRTRLREQDLVVRFGGDEFVLLLPDTDSDGAAAIVAELARNSPASWTAGIATVEPAESFESVLGRADADLYRKKQRRDGLPEATVPRA